MATLLVTYTHLIATCMALGLIVTTDLRLLAKMVSYRCVIRPPRRFERRVIAIALAGLCLSGAAHIALSLDANPGPLSNPKLVAKMLLVAVLCLNAVVLHRITFPRLMQRHMVSTWTLRDHLSVALPVALSNTLWLYCAFLGIARSWNHSKSLTEILLLAVAFFGLAAAGILMALQVAARDQPQTPPDWIDSMKARLSDHAPLGGYRASFEDSTHGSA